MMNNSRFNGEIENIISKIELNPHVELGFYEELAPIYDFLYGTSYDYKGQADIVEKHHDDVSSILEVGCGTGRLTEYLEEHFSDADVLGIDLHSDMVEIAEERFTDNEKMSFRTQDFFEMESDAKFDVITAFGVKPHLSREEHRNFFVTAAKLLKKDGLLVFDYKDPEYEVNGRFNPWEKETDKYRVESRFTTVYKDEQPFYAVSYEFNDKDTEESYSTGCLIEIHFHAPERLEKQLEETGFKVEKIYKENMDQSGGFVARKN